MSKKNRIRKKFNPLKQMKKVASYGLRNVGVFKSLQRHQDGDCEVVNYKKAKTIDIDQSTAGAIIGVRHKWVVHIGAIGHNGFDTYLKQAVINLPYECFQSEIAGVLDKEHRAFVEREINKEHLMDIVWLALPVGEELSEQEFGEFLEGMGVL